jgi:hypothetical protein
MLTYFAYGSNMLTRRFRERSPGCHPLRPAYLPGYSLRWHKRSRTGSGKCDAFQTSTEVDVLWGVLFAIPESEKESLDKAEGVGQGYMEKEVQVMAADQWTVAFTYVAAPDSIDPSLRPFGWYRDLVLAGAQEHGLSEEHLERIASQPVTADPDRSREARKRRLLEQAGGA